LFFPRRNQGVTINGSLFPKLRKIAQGLVVHEPKQILELEEIKRDEEN